MKLNTSQIQSLYIFTQKHYVDWYDVQTELVDHLANGIETLWENNPKLSFEEALKIEFKKFGVCGFGDVIEQKTKALNKQYRLLIWQYFKAFFKLPKIIITLFLVWGYYQLLIYIPNRFWIIIPTAILLVVFPIWEIYKQSKHIKQLRKTTNKKWLFDNTILQLGGTIHFLSLLLQISFFDINASWGVTSSLLFSIIVVFFAIVLYVALFVVSPQLKKRMSTYYTDYKFT